MSKTKKYMMCKKGNNESFSPIFHNKELVSKLDAYCCITNQNKTNYCERILLEHVSRDIRAIQEKLNGCEQQRFF